MLGVPGVSPLSDPESGVADRRDLLARLIETMLASATMDDVLQAIPRGMVQLGAASSGLMLVGRDEDCPVCTEQRRGSAGESAGTYTLHMRAVAGTLVEPLDVADEYHRVPLEGSVSGRALTTGKPVLVADATHDEAYSGITRWLIQQGITSFAAYPLQWRSGDTETATPLGVLTVGARQPIDETVFEHMKIFALQASVALRAAELLAELTAQRERLAAENDYLREERLTDHGFDGIVGESSALTSMLQLVSDVAATDTTVLLTGETGTGKELIAHAIHSRSVRSAGPFITMNSGAITAGLAESELFGHERGAYTGALQRRIGRFELADHGTLFLDEIGELPLDLQVRLLRVLQEREFERVGGSRPIRVDVRLIAATNRDLEREVANGRFRADLFYRVNVFPIRLPPLRERTSDIPLLARYFVGGFARKFGKNLRGLTPASMERLVRYSWPGNIRELQNVIERACVRATGPLVDIVDPLSARGSATEPVDHTLESAERAHIRRVLELTNWRIEGSAGAAQILGVPGSTLRSRMLKLKISRTVGS